MGIFSKRDDERGWHGNVSWSTSCTSDLRFNMNGYCGSIWSATAQVDKAVRAKAAELNIPEDKIPEDIEYGGCKS